MMDIFVSFLSDYPSKWWISKVIRIYKLLKVKKILSLNKNIYHFNLFLYYFFLLFFFILFFLFFFGLVPSTRFALISSDYKADALLLCKPGAPKSMTTSTLGNSDIIQEVDDTINYEEPVIPSENFSHIVEYFRTEEASDAQDRMNMDW